MSKDLNPRQETRMHNPTIIKAREEKELDEIGTWITALDDSPADHDEYAVWMQLEKEIRELDDLEPR